MMIEALEGRELFSTTVASADPTPVAPATETTSMTEIVCTKKVDIASSNLYRASSGK